MNKSHRGAIRNVNLFSYSLSVVLVLGYIIIYRLYPFNDSWNDIALSGITAASAAFAAIIATLIYRHYELDDPPRIVWKNLMYACWLWLLGEVIWGYFYVAIGEVPVGSADWTWVVGFVFFTLALYHQYKLVDPSRVNYFRKIAIVAWVIVLLIPLAIAYFTNSFDFETYITYYYPFADLAVGIAGLMLMFVFQGGTLMRPWVGLVVFSVTDLLYAWAEQTGLYAWSIENSNILTLFIDVSYIIAYIILALGFLGHWVFVNYGIQGWDEDL